jgi:branched-chain amino acid transport system substrate-binding protein
MCIASLGELTKGEPFDEENTGWGWKVLETIETAQTVLPTTCQMIRPN